MTDRRSRWTLRCRDLLSREAFVITSLDPASDNVLLQVTGSKAVRLTRRDVARLRRQLDEAERAILDASA